MGIIESRLAARGSQLAAICMLLLGPVCASAQSTNSMIRKGNRYYNKKQLDASVRQYEDAVKKSPDNATARYNLGDAEFRKDSFDLAAKSFDASAANSADSGLREKSLYNSGVALIRQQKLRESIEAWKKALELDASDSDARENLQKALMELKRQQSQQQKNQKKDQKDKKEKKQDKKQEQQQPQQQAPKPQSSRLTKQQVEQLLKVLQQKENELQEKMNQNKVKAPNQPEKDW